MGNCVKKNSAKAGNRRQTGASTKSGRSAASTESKGRRLQMTKGASMYVPEDHASLGRDYLADEGENQIIEFLEEENEEFNNSVYSKVGELYKVGDDVIYAEEMLENVTFDLKATRDGEENATTVTFAYKTLNGKTTQLVDKANQDSLSIVRLPIDPHQAIFGVFDGHGPYGEHASHFCRMTMIKEYSAAKAKFGDEASPETLLEATLHNLHKRFCSTNQYSSGVDPFVSGTTGIVVFLNGNEIIAANVGDSRAILGSKASDGVIEVVALSSDHKPQREDEKKRIQQTKAVLLTEADIRGVPSNSDDENGKTYICREKRGEIIYGVLFSRSIGDVDAHKHLGVITDPEFDKATIDPTREQCVVVASDGVWDQMTNEEVIDIIFESNNPLKACDKIVQIASDRWTASEEHRRDDITLTILGLGESFVTATAD